MNDHPPIKTNRHGNVDLRQGVPDGVRHIPHKAYGAMGIRSMLWYRKFPCAPAFMGFKEKDDGPGQLKSHGRPSSLALSFVHPITTPS